MIIFLLLLNDFATQIGFWGVFDFDSDIVANTYFEASKLKHH